MNNMNRRQVLGTLAGIGAALTTFAVLPKASAEEKKRGGAAPAGGGSDLPLVEPGKDTAAAVKYVHHNSDVKDAALKVDRQGVKFDKQTCAGCGFYKAAGKKGADEVGTCTIFAGKVVKSTGWCQSWNKKA